MAEKTAPSRPSEEERVGPPKTKKKSHKAEGSLAKGARDAQQTSLAECNAQMRAAAARAAELARKKREVEEAAIAKVYADAGA